ncbi:DUF6392 family protein [Stutzerimonas nitrititolerans]|uniref:Immunity protein n=1 Tax=Stutzerimonas nitrititolerans TaxID=2482751 RepID=A0ABX9V483_9GAMM|nr:DUF6392 family protein [Stutzerimonas nitrititolerans]RMI00632.1 immunity protein [Stutzerimonas nitrititolerans]
MDAVTINRLARGLGRTYDELVSESLIQGSPVPLFTEGRNEDLIHKPAPGIELWFWAETKKLERVVITLAALVQGDELYTGELPTPFTHRMNQSGVRDLLGDPYQTKGPVKLPPPIGVTGGWDAYRLGQAFHPNAEIVVQYLQDTTAAGLAFELIDKGHD